MSNSRRLASSGWPSPTPTLTRLCPALSLTRCVRSGVSYENGSEFHYPQYRKKQSELLAEVVSKEGPIHIELATKRVIAAWGLTRAGVRIIEAIAEAVRLCESMSLLEKRGDFLGPRG